VRWVTVATAGECADAKAKRSFRCACPKIPIASLVLDRRRVYPVADGLL